MCALVYLSVYMCMCVCTCICSSAHTSVAVRACVCVNQGAQAVPLAVSTPRGEELYQPHRIALHHQLVEVVVCQLHHVLGATSTTTALEDTRKDSIYQSVHSRFSPK